jgi:hypothetical protein
LCLVRAEHLSRLTNQLTADLHSKRASLPPRADPKLYNDDEFRGLNALPAQKGRSGLGR